MHVYDIRELINIQRFYKYQLIFWSMNKYLSSSSLSEQFPSFTVNLQNLAFLEKLSLYPVLWGNKNFKVNDLKAHKHSLDLCLTSSHSPHLTACFSWRPSCTLAVNTFLCRSKYSIHKLLQNISISGCVFCLMQPKASIYTQDCVIHGRSLA